MPAPRHAARIAPPAVALACALTAFAPRARADDNPDPAAAAVSGEDRAAAAREFAEGQRAFGAGDYRLAAEQFEAAYKHKPHHAALWNAARARQRAGDVARAANLYARYLREAPPNARDRNTAMSALRQLAGRLGQLEITAVGLDDVRVDRDPTFDRMVYVNPGAHVVEARAAKGDRRVTQSASVDAGQTVSVALVAPSEAPTPSTPTSPTPTPAPTPGPAPGPAKDEPPHGIFPPIVVWTGLGLTVIAAGLTVISGLDVLSQRSTFDKDPSPANLDAGKSKQLRTNILLGASVGLGVLTGVSALWLVDWRGKDRSVRVGVGLGDVTVRGTF